MTMAGQDLNQVTIHCNKYQGTVKNPNSPSVVFESKLRLVFAEGGRFRTRFLFKYKWLRFSSSSKKREMCHLRSWRPRPSKTELGQVVGQDKRLLQNDLKTGVNYYLTTLHKKSMVDVLLLSVSTTAQRIQTEHCTLMKHTHAEGLQFAVNTFGNIWWLTCTPYCKIWVKYL